jgi:amino acid transporter
MAMVVATVALVAGNVLVDAFESTVLPKAKSYFTIHSSTTRTWVQLDTIGDYLSQFWWMLPTALIGPTLHEVIHRPIMLLTWLAGLAVVAAMANALLVALRAREPFERKLLLLSWLPAVAALAFAYVPFGIYNPGSGIRYASSFLPFVLYPRLLQQALRDPS